MLVTAVLATAFTSATSAHAQTSVALSVDSHYQFESLTMRKVDAATYDIVGFIRPQFGTAIADLRVTAVLRDAGGAEVARTTGTTGPYALARAVRVPIKIVFQDVSGDPVSFEVVAATSQIAVQTPNSISSFTVDPEEATATGPRYSGSIKNTRAAPVENVQLLLVLYRRDDYSLEDVIPAQIEGGSTIAPGATAHWHADWSGDAASVSAGCCWAMSTSELAPLPLHVVGTRPGFLAPYRLRTITYGQSIRLADQAVKEQTVTPAAGRRLGYSFKTPLGGWIARVVTADSTGHFGYTLRPANNTTWRYDMLPVPETLVAVENANHDGHGHIVVRQAVAATLSSTSVARGQAAYLSGTVGPNKRLQAVTLQRLVNGSWSTVASQALNNSSAYRFRLPTAARGGYTYRVSKPADMSNAANVSPARALRVT